MFSDKPISNSNGKRGSNSGAGPKRVLERHATPGSTTATPKDTPIHIAMTTGGRGTSGRKGYPSLPKQ